MVRGLRAPAAAARRHGAAAGAAAVKAPAPPVASTLPVPTFSEVKFKKEDVEQVMLELPEFNFYEMKEDSPNPYKGTTMDRSILISPPQPSLVAPKLEFSKLENGLKVASIDKQGLTASLGLFVSAGSRFETVANLGVSNMVSMMAYRSTAHLSHLRTVKTLEQLGANSTATCIAGREETSYQVSVLREFVPLVVPLMIGNVLFPRLLPWEVKDASKQVKVERAALAGDADAMVNEMLHKAAYFNNTLGQSPVASERSLAYFNQDTIRSYLMDHFAPERMVLVGVNVAHSELAKWAMRSFVDYNAIPLKDREAAKAVYMGGDLRNDVNSPFCHAALGLESVPWGQAELAPVSLLRTILGAGSANSKGISSDSISRLQKQIIEQNPYVESCAAFNTSYSDGGLFGVYGVSQAAKSGDMAISMAKTLKSLTTVSADELAIAKAALKVKMFRDSDDDLKLMKDLGQQLLLTGTYGSASDFAKMIDAVTPAQLTAAATKLLSSKLTFVAHGDNTALPHYSAIEAALK